MAFHLIGVTRDANGNPLGSVLVMVFDTATDAFLGSDTSDGSGNYDVTLSGPTAACFAVGYLTGSPDVAGTTLNNLVPVEDQTLPYFAVMF